jgi:Predicted membrane protein
MTSGEYLKQLEKYLRKLPQSDYEDAMEYFTEYFADAGPENEQAVIKELGTPKQAAAELMRNLLDKKVMNARQWKRRKTEREEKNDRRQRRLDRDSRPVCSPDRSPDSDQHSHRSALRGPLCGTA